MSKNVMEEYVKQISGKVRKDIIESSRLYRYWTPEQKAAYDRTHEKYLHHSGMENRHYYMSETPEASADDGLHAQHKIAENAHNLAHKIYKDANNLYSKPEHPASAQKAPHYERYADMLGEIAHKLSKELE